VDPHDYCPTCGDYYSVQCRCMISHRQCPKGHQWFRCKECRRSTVGPGSHSGDESANLCSFCKAKG